MMKNKKQSLIISGIVSADILTIVENGFKSDSWDSKYLDVFCMHSQFEISLGSNFNCLIDLSNNCEYEVELKLLCVTQEWALPFDNIPVGHKTICRFEIKNNDYIFYSKLLPTIEDWYVGEKYFELIKNE